MAPAGSPRAKKGILERLDSGEVVVGDGGFLLTLEKRGYVKAGLWTPESVVEHPNAGPYPRPMEVTRLEVELELQQLA